MNRAERRSKQKADRKARKKLWPGGYVEISKESGIKDGDIFTIPGIKRNEDGTIITNCKPGDETKWIARVSAN